MTDRPPAQPPPDPPGNGSNPPSRSASTTRSRTIRPPPTVFDITSSQTPDRATVSGLAAYENNRSRKRLATSHLNDRTGPSSQTLLGTPRSTRIKKIFANNTPNNTLLKVTCKLYNIIKSSIPLPKKGGAKISSLGSETATDIKILAATALNLVYQSSNIPLFNRQLTSNDEDNHQVERTLAGPNAFGCKVPEVVESRLDKIDKNLAKIMNAFKAPSRSFNFCVPANKQPQTPSYALAASKHAPNQR